MEGIAKWLGFRSNIMQIISYSVETSYVLGQGAFGVVFKGTDTSKIPIAAKRIDGKQHPKVLTLTYKKFVEIDHQNIIKILDVHTEDMILWMFMEFCNFGDLNKFYSKNKVTPDKSIRIMKQIMNGIAYLHEKDIVHRDIKPANILVASEEPVIVKLTDFDVSKCLDPEIETSKMSSNVGTNAFKAPEFFMRNELKKICYHRNVDIYAAGLTFLAILQHDQERRMLIPRIETPLEDSELHLSIGQLIAERIKYKVPELNVVKLSHTSQDLFETEIRKLVQHMTCIEPEERPSANDIRKGLTKVRVVGRVGTENIVLKEFLFTESPKLNRFFFSKLSSKTIDRKMQFRNINRKKTCSMVLILYE